MRPCVATVRFPALGECGDRLHVAPALRQRSSTRVSCARPAPHDRLPPFPLYFFFLSALWAVSLYLNELTATGIPLSSTSIHSSLKSAAQGQSSLSVTAMQSLPSPRTHVEGIQGIQGGSGLYSEQFRRIIRFTPSLGALCLRACLSASYPYPPPMLISPCPLRPRPAALPLLFC